MRYLFSSYYNLDDPPRKWQETYTRGRTMRNPGDLVYLAGLMDILRTDANTEFIPTGYVAYVDRLPLSVKEINETCAALVMPFADHFRDNRVRMLNRYADLVRKLKIPAVVPCIGVRSDAITQETDAAAKRFVSAVLDKSALIGLRGETTARYLEKLGFVRDRHFTVVGCPSLYCAGPDLPAFSWPENPESCAFGLNHRAGEAVNRFLIDSARKIPRRRFITQYDFEFIKLFVSAGVRQGSSYRIPWYWDMVVSTVRDGSYRYFYNLNSWKQCLRSLDCSMSSRIHGTILALLCGVPSVIVPFESRTRELAEYHAIPTIRPEEISPGDTVEKFKDRFDFEAMRKRHRENFAHFLDFLHRNGLKTVFDDGGSPRPGPGADILAEDIPCETMKPLCEVSSTVRIGRDMQWKLIELRRILRKHGIRFPSGIPVS